MQLFACRWLTVLLLQKPVDYDSRQLHVGRQRTMVALGSGVSGERQEARFMAIAVVSAAKFQNIEQITGRRNVRKPVGEPGAMIGMRSVRPGRR